jgi:hypothetical protein
MWLEAGVFLIILMPCAGALAAFLTLEKGHLHEWLPRWFPSKPAGQPYLDLARKRNVRLRLSTMRWMRRKDKFGPGPVQGGERREALDTKSARPRLATSILGSSGQPLHNGLQPLHERLAPPRG